MALIIVANHAGEDDRHLGEALIGLVGYEVDVWHGMPRRARLVHGELGAVDMRTMRLRIETEHDVAEYVPIAQLVRVEVLSQQREHVAPMSSSAPGTCHQPAR